ncbi:hypothetical protein BDR26DRAFT_922530 [Obelidium mucronatum]|nr:hypothetical protein BDR26DRAFT_922530 [Obelidium mucronatum]
MSCHHVDRPASVKRMSPQQLNANANKYMAILTDQSPFVAPSGKTVSMNAASAVHMLRATSGAHFARFLLAQLGDRADVWTSDAQLFYLEIAVDAFLNHDFEFASSCYGMYLLIAHVLWAGGRLAQLFGGDGAPTVAALPLFGGLAAALGDERGLLAALQGNPRVACDCLNAEDPYHPHFGRVVPRNLLFDVELETRPRGYKLDCARCRRSPDLAADGKDFKKCSRCQRVRYCSVDCQKSDWKEHKPMCGLKTADWWGRTPKMSKQQRLDMGLV